MIEMLETAIGLWLVMLNVAIAVSPLALVIFLMEKGEAKREREGR